MRLGLAIIDLPSFSVPDPIIPVSKQLFGFSLKTNSFILRLCLKLHHVVILNCWLNEAYRKFTKPLPSVRITFIFCWCLVIELSFYVLPGRSRYAVVKQPGRLCYT